MLLDVQLEACEKRRRPGDALRRGRDDVVVALLLLLPPPIKRDFQLLREDVVASVVEVMLWASVDVGIGLDDAAMMMMMIDEDDHCSVFCIQTNKKTFSLDLFSHW